MKANVKKMELVCRGSCIFYNTKGSTAILHPFSKEAFILGIYLIFIISEFL
jgi:hypothetical protein